MAKIQFNLLPERQLQSAQRERRQRLTITLSVLISLISVGLFVLSFLTVNIVQTKQLKDTNNQIDDLKSQLNKVSNLNQVLTVQNQLQTLATIHQNKHISSRIFGYLPQVTPTNVNIGRLALDFTTNTMIIDGTADSQHTVNTFIDTLKFTTYSVPNQNGSKNAFPSVIESSFSIGQGNVNYSLTIRFDPVLFSNSLTNDQGQSVKPQLHVPTLTTTRSVVNDPSNVIFNGQNTGAKPTR